MTTSVKITALTDIGNAISPTTLVPVVNMVGTPETEKANLQIVGNLILAGAGSANFVAAASATTAGTVTTAAQPNITSTGTLTALTVTGNVNSGNVNTTAVVASGNITGGNASLGNAVVANYFVGRLYGNANVAFSVSVANVSGIGNIATANLDGNASNVLYGNGSFAARSIDWVTAPSANDSTGTAGQVAYDAGGNLFICVATDSWSKITGTTSW
jgi:hypothetical protein